MWQNSDLSRERTAVGPDGNPYEAFRSHMEVDTHAVGSVLGQLMAL